MHNEPHALNDDKYFVLLRLWIALQLYTPQFFVSHELRNAFPLINNNDYIFLALPAKSEKRVHILLSCTQFICPHIFDEWSGVIKFTLCESDVLPLFAPTSDVFNLERNGIIKTFHVINEILDSWLVLAFTLKTLSTTSSTIEHVRAQQCDEALGQHLTSRSTEYTFTLFLFKQCANRQRIRSYLVYSSILFNFSILFVFVGIRVGIIHNIFMVANSQFANIHSDDRTISDENVSVQSQKWVRELKTDTTNHKFVHSNRKNKA